MTTTGDISADDDVVQRALAMTYFTASDVAIDETTEGTDHALSVLGRLVQNGDLVVDARSNGGRWTNFYRWVN